MREVVMLYGRRCHVLEVTRMPLGVRRSPSSGVSFCGPPGRHVADGFLAEQAAAADDVVASYAASTAVGRARSDWRPKRPRTCLRP